MKKCFAFLILVAVLVIGLTAMAPIPEPGDRSFTEYWAMAGGIAYAQPPDIWFEADQVTIGWDPVTTLEDGAPVPVDDLITYTVILKEESSAAVIVVESGITAIPYTITLPGEGGYRVGITPTRHYTSYAMSAPTSWSSDGAVTADGIPFGILRVRAPAAVKGLYKN